MGYEELTLREEEAFRNLADAFARRERVHALVAAFSAHRQGYDKAVSDLATALSAYEVAARALMESREAETMGRPAGRSWGGAAGQPYSQRSVTPQRFY